jgi:hypothetical protein
MPAESAFGWFTGIADIAAPCPPALAAEGGLARFFSGPNHEDFGATLPRLLMHEALHAFQLVASRWLQRMVAEEWERVLAFERDGTAPPIGPLRHGFGRATSGAPFTVRDLVECLARFWDVHSRGPAQMLKEEGNTLGGLVALIDAERARRGDSGYSQIEFDAVMTAGRDAAVYAAPYRWMLDCAQRSEFLRAITAEKPEQLPKAASFAVALTFPMAGFIALNTEDPVAAFLRMFERSLDADVLHGAFAQRNPWGSINLDWLTCWPVLVEGYARILRREGLAPAAGIGPIGREGWDAHPVWRHVAARFDALKRGLFAMLMTEDPPGFEIGRPWRAAERTAEAGLFERSAFAVCGLPGHPDFRLQLAAAFLPPLIRLTDRSLSGGECAAGFAPWPEPAEALVAAATAAERRHARLRAADAERQFGLPPGSFGR